MRFSVITPSFRQLEWLELCAASIADQAVEFEHLVQDAGSPGIENWAASHPSVQVFIEKDAGMYDAVNRGLRRATGEICSYLNCDEQYLPGTLQRVADYFRQHPKIDVLFGDAILTDPELTPLSYRRVVTPRQWHTLLRPLNVLTCATFFRRKIVDEGALFDPDWKIIGDRAWILSLINRGYHMGTLNEPLSVFALTGANMSNDEKVDAELRHWATRVPAGVRLIKPWVQASHLLEKWERGAYKKRATRSSWYTKKSISQRHDFRGLPLNWNWPILAR
jgi:glycosyltransferase involved in cell wall biosynthesis